MPPDLRPRSSMAGFTPPKYPAPAPGMLRLDANTNLWGPNPAVERVLHGEIPDVAQYPTPFSDELREALAARHGVSVDQIIVGNGSDEIFDFVAKAFLDPGDPVAVPRPSFVMHGFYGKVNFGSVAEVPLREDFRLDEAGLTGTKAKLTILASPNNPTGNAFDAAALERVIRGARGVVVLDEAYAEYCGQDFTARIGEFENLIVARTFSKAYGLAAVRVGYAVAGADLIREVYRVKPPFTVGALPERIAVEALRERRFVEECVAGVRAERERLAEEARGLGLEPRPSDANFMLLDTGTSGAAMAERLERKGILVRELGPPLESFIRVTIGRPEHSDALLKALRDILS